MNFTFGIVTDGSNDEYIKVVIESIEKNNIPFYEIIIVGNTKCNINLYKNLTIFEIDESIKLGWITKKKNIIVENAKYENIVLMHDYIKLNEDWYSGFLRFGDNFEWCVNVIKNKNGERFRDYSLFPYKTIFCNYSFGDVDDYFNNNCLLPYDFINNNKTNKYMYISGSYYVIKKDVALKHKLDETLCLCQGEDVELSKRLHDNNIIIKCNKFSCVSFLKDKESRHWEREISQEKLDFFINYCNSS
jgi:hypothetical protein